MTFSPQVFASRLLKKDQLTPDVFSFYFKRPQAFDFIPGQYLKMELTIKNLDDRGASRFFSIASSPTERDHLMITTRILKSSFKKTLGSLPIGAKAQMRGPYGMFVLGQQDTRAKVYLAGGIGIVPARSMLVYLKNKNLATPFILMAAFRSREEIIYENELSLLSCDIRKIVYIATSEDGRIDKEKIRKNVTDLNSLFYISGPPGFVAAMKQLVKSIGVSEENIKTEDFPGY
jgi:ferredoxin-NADP reductase